MRFYLKTIFFPLALAVFFGGILMARTSFGQMKDEEQSLNSFSAGVLDFSLSSSEDKRDISIINNGNVDFQYKVETIITGGNKEFCNLLQVSVKLNGSEKYSESLSELNILSVYEASAVWNFQISLPIDSAEEYSGQNCNFEFVYTGWQKNLEYKQGFSDIETESNIFTAAIVENIIMEPMLSFMSFANIALDEGSNFGTDESDEGEDATDNVISDQSLLGEAEFNFEEEQTNDDSNLEVNEDNIGEDEKSDGQVLTNEDGIKGDVIDNPPVINEIENTDENLEQDDTEPNADDVPDEDMETVPQASE